ncbi:MAG: hypothetical protein KAJ14_02700 [Candidatus Omnitrophica bacterium]|nr:hypothetical protein [Candidatus Omnitrophota bacterium]
MINKRKKAQSINEYALILGIIAVVLVSMQTYFKRGINGLIRRSADEIGDIAEKDWTQYYSDRNKNYLLTAQTLGTMEQGLISYKLNVDGVWEPLTSDTTKTFKLTENKNSSAIKTINNINDKTVFKGAWTHISKFDSLGTFSSNAIKEDDEDE